MTALDLPSSSTSEIMNDSCNVARERSEAGDVVVKSLNEVLSHKWNLVLLPPKPSLV